MVFDALFVPGKDIREKPLLERKEILKALLPSDPLVRYSESVADGLFPSLGVRPNSPSGRVKARCGILPSLGCASTKRRWMSSAPHA